MIVFVCIDDLNGMMFNYRRQSRDVKLLEDIKEMIGDTPICISKYSESLFTNLNVNYSVMTNPMKTVLNPKYCFVENTIVDLNDENIEQIVIYKWNRKYPGDVFFDYEYLKNNFKLISTNDFVGNSHEKITKEVWSRDEFCFRNFQKSW